MKKITKFLPFLMTACVLGGVATAKVDNVSASADTETNTTFTVQSGYKSSFFANVSSHKQKKGVSIEFDLYETDFKEMNYNKDFDIMQSSGTFGSLAAVSFTFGKVAANYPDPNPKNAPIPAWHTYVPNEYNFGGFQYFCNGEIKEWHNVGMSVRVTDYIGYPSQFMEEGYSYKVMLRYDRFEFEGTTYNPDGNAWFCVERKGIFEDESAYEPLFAYKKKQTANYTDGTLAGMDIQGLCINANGSQGATSADGLGHSLHMELDNVRIYDGKKYETAAEKHAENFENVSADALATPNMTVNDAEHVKYSNKNYYEHASGIRQILTNFGSAIGISEETTCRVGVKTRELYNVTFKDASTQETVGTQKTFTGFDFSSARIFKGEQVYQFDYSRIDYDMVKGDVEVFGTPVSYFTMRIYSGVDTIKDKVMRVGVREKVLLDKGLFVREGYNLAGFSLTEGDDTVKYEVGDIVDMKCQDMTLYAVWKLPEYKTTYKLGNLTLEQIITNVGETPFYQGATPEKAGYVFAGWSKTAEQGKDQSITANFIQLEDVNASNKAVFVENSVTFKREGYAEVSSVDVCFDLIALPQGAEIKVLGTDITELLKDKDNNNNFIEGYKIRVTVSKQGNIVVSKAYIGTDVYENLGTTTAVSGSNTSMEFTFANGVVFDTLTMSYNGQNAFTQTFEGSKDISTGIFDNYYTVEGSANVVDYAKDIVVTFEDMTGRVVATTYTYAGGNVKLINKVEGISHNIVWDKSQNDLHNIQGNIVVKADLTWKNCSVSFVITKIFGFMESEGISIAPKTATYGSEIALPSATYGDYAIIGWTDVANGNYAKYTGNYVLTEDACTLYAVWGGKSVVVEFYAEDGTTLLETQTVENKATVRFGGEIPEKPGYKFVGWDKSTVGVTQDTKFIAQYQKILKKVQVSVLGGTGAGRYTEGDVVTIAFRDIKGLDFVDWKVVSGNVTITENNGVYTFVVGTQDVVVEAVTADNGEVNTQSEGCTSTASVGIVAMALLCGCAYTMFKKRGEE